MQCSVTCGTLMYHFDSVHLSRNHWCANSNFVRGWRCPYHEGFVACRLAARIPRAVTAEERKLLCQGPIGPEQNNVVIDQDQEASERKMCKNDIVDRVRLVHRNRCLLLLKRILTK